MFTDIPCIIVYRDTIFPSIFGMGMLYNFGIGMPYILVYLVQGCRIFWYRDAVYPSIFGTWMPYILVYLVQGCRIS